MTNQVKENIMVKSLRGDICLCAVKFSQCSHMLESFYTLKNPKEQTHRYSCQTAWGLGDGQKGGRGLRSTNCWL